MQHDYNGSAPSAKHTPFSQFVINAVRGRVDPAFRETVQGTPEMKAEIKKVLQRANRRAQNIERAGLPSPALKALYAERGSAAASGVYSKFSITGLDIRDPIQWEMAKQEYGRAMSFLNNPTSTATGTRQYIKGVAEQYTGGKFDPAVKLVDVATSPQISQSGAINVFNYGDIIEEFAADVQQVAEEMAIDADQLGEHLEEIVDQLAANAKVQDDIFYSIYDALHSPRIR